MLFRSVPQPSQHFEAVHSGQRQIQQDEGDVLIQAGQIERFVARLGLQKLELPVQGLEHLPQSLADQRMIVDNQNFQTSSLPQS